MRLLYLLGCPGLPKVAADLGALVGGYLSSSSVTRGKSLDRTRLSHRLQRPSACPHLFGLFAIQIKVAVLFTLPTDLFPADRVATVWGVFGAVGSVGGSLLGLLAGFMIQGPGYESVFLMIASLHLISALPLQIFVPKIVMVAD